MRVVYYATSDNPPGLDVGAGFDESSHHLVVAVERGVMQRRVRLLILIV